LIVYPDSRVVVALVTNLSDSTWKTKEVKAVAEAFEAIKKNLCSVRRPKQKKRHDCSRPLVEP
jgi:hypothetical protein